MNKDQIAYLEKIGTDGVRKAIIQDGAFVGRPGSKVREEVEEWLRSKSDALSAADAVKRDAREEETLRLAKEANAIARDSNRLASEANLAALDANRIALDSKLLASNANRLASRANLWSMIAAIAAATAEIISMMQ